MGGMPLRQDNRGPAPQSISFISLKTKTSFKRSSHLYVEEAGVIQWAVKNFRKYMYGMEFTVMTDYSSLKTFFENTDHTSHMMQRWKAKLLQFHFVIEYHPARMMW